MSDGMIIELKPKINIPNFPPSPAQDELFSNIWHKVLLGTGTRAMMWLTDR